MKFLAMDDGAAILLTFVALAVIIILSVIFFFLIKRNLRLEREEHEIIVENAITRNQMISAVEQYIKRLIVLVL
jgi:preprotein translocase subunit YajC